MRIAGFLFVGSIGFGIDYGLTACLANAGGHLVLARLPALAVAITATWWLNRTLTFGLRARPTLAEYARYVSVSALGTLLNYGLYIALILAGFRLAAAIVLPSLVVMALSYIGYSRIAFREGFRSSNPPSAVTSGDSRRGPCNASAEGHSRGARCASREK